MHMRRTVDRLLAEEARALAAEWMPGGGMAPPPAKRNPKAVHRDIRLGYLSPEAAKRDYGA
jgi:N-methylhydantoinase B/oxoprolinase/acetone carboxylase alpha subunit